MATPKLPSLEDIGVKKTEENHVKGLGIGIDSLRIEEGKYILKMQTKQSVKELISTNRYDINQYRSDPSMNCKPEVLRVQGNLDILYSMTWNKVLNAFQENGERVSPDDFSKYLKVEVFDENGTQLPFENTTKIKLG